MKSQILLLLFVIVCGLDAKTVPWTRSQTTGVDWVQRAQDELQKATSRPYNLNPAKNVILFIGDGMGISTMTAARIRKAQTQGKSVTEGHLVWEDFADTGLIKSYNTDQQTGDSGGCATAILCGEKTRAGVIGYKEVVERGEEFACQNPENQLTSIMHHAIAQGKVGGIITTSEVTEATPSPAFAHSSERNWNTDGAMPPGSPCMDIARQIVDVDINKDIKVWLGGGRRVLTPNNMSDPEYSNLFGSRKDGRNLIQEWLDQRVAMNLDPEQYAYVYDAETLENMDRSQLQHLMGLFEPGKMKYDADRQEEVPGVDIREPSVAEMVGYAIDVLEKNPDGYILLVEGAKIDNGHHETNAYRSLTDVLALEAAVQVAVDKTNVNDTLLVVSADHSHVFTISGYPHLEADILGLVIDQNGQEILGDDDKPFLILGYANGPGYDSHRPDGSTRMNLTGVDTTGKDFLQDATIPKPTETHGGEDLAVYAEGPLSHIFVGQHEQHYIAHAIMYATCIGPYSTCEHSPTTTTDSAHLLLPNLAVYFFIISSYVLCCM